VNTSSVTGLETTVFTRSSIGSINARNCLSASLIPKTIEFSRRKGNS
jgi:hypothetical protein